MCAPLDLSAAVVYGTFTDKVKVERDGGVTIPGHGRPWMDCPSCGPQPPTITATIESVGVKQLAEPPLTGWRVVYHQKTVYRARLEWLRIPYVKRNGKKGFEIRPRGACSKCGAIVVGRVITMTGSGAGKEQCNGACLSGRRSCNCHCGGRCHGAGECHCGKAAR